MQDPDLLADIDLDDSIFNESFGYIALEVYEDKTGEEMPRKEFEELEEPTGQMWDFDNEEENKKQLPRLWEKYK